MEKMQKIQKIRSDLRELRKLSHAITTQLELKHRHEERRAYLKGLGSLDVMIEIERIDAILASLKIEDSIKRAGELELAYMEAIGKLGIIDRTVVIDGYLNGVPFWKIGKKLGYSEDGIKKRAARALDKLAEML